MSNRTTFPELIEYFPAYYDELNGEHYAHRFISKSDLSKCLMSDSLKKQIDANICQCGGLLNDKNHLDMGEIDLKYCGICGGIYVMKIIEK